MWSDCLRSLHLNHIRETQFRYSDSNNRPDITVRVFDQQSGTTIDLDIVVVHPWCPDVLGKAAKEDGAAAARREEIKTRSGGGDGGNCPSNLRINNCEKILEETYLNFRSRV